MNTVYSGYNFNEAKAEKIPLQTVALMNLYYTLFFQENDERALNQLVTLWQIHMENPNETPKKCPKCIRKIEILFPILLTKKQNEYERQIHDNQQ